MGNTSDPYLGKGQPLEAKRAAGWKKLLAGTPPPHRPLIKSPRQKEVGVGMGGFPVRGNKLLAGLKLAAGLEPSPRVGMLFVLRKAPAGVPQARGLLEGQKKGQSNACVWR